MFGIVQRSSSQDLCISFEKLRFWKLFLKISHFLNLFIYLFLESGEGREKKREKNTDGREKHGSVPSHIYLQWGLNLQPTHVPRLGVKPETFVGHNWATTWDTPVKATYSTFRLNCNVFIAKVIHSNSLEVLFWRTKRIWIYWQIFQNRSYLSEFNECLSGTYCVSGPVIHASHLKKKGGWVGTIFVLKELIVLM